MHANIAQLNRLAILIADAEQNLIRVEPTLVHLRDGSILATIDGEHHVIDRAGQLAPAADDAFARIAA